MTGLEITEASLLTGRDLAVDALPGNLPCDPADSQDARSDDYTTIAKS